MDETEKQPETDEQPSGNAGDTSTPEKPADGGEKKEGDDATKPE
jgi:hypothetical protein